MRNANLTLPYFETSRVTAASGLTTLTGITHDTNILDIDAKVDNEIIVLRERRAVGQYVIDGGVNYHGRRNSHRQHCKHQKIGNYSGRDQMNKVVRNIRHYIKDLKKYWSNLPHQHCSNEGISSVSDGDGMCWNGNTIGRYYFDFSSDQISSFAKVILI